MKNGSNRGPEQPVTSKLLVGVESPVNGVLHGVKSTLVVAVPHVRGLASVARDPPPKLNLKSLNGSCGLFSKLAVIWPVCWSIDAVPSSFTTIPDSPSPTTWTNSRTIRPSCASRGVHGLHEGDPRYTWPTSASSSAGVLIDTVPTCDSRGHPAGTPECKPNCSSEHDTKPLAEDGEITVPTGNATVTSFTSGVAN